MDWTTSQKLYIKSLHFQLLTSTVQEDGYELSMTLTFAIRGNKDPLTGRKLGMTGDYLSTHTERDNYYRSDSEEGTCHV